MADVADVADVATPMNAGTAPIDAPVVNAWVVGVVIVEPSTGVPALVSLDPASVVIGTAPVVMHVHGSGFSPNAAVQLNAVMRPATFVSPAELTVDVDPAWAPGPLTTSVVVRDGPNWSNPLAFEFAAAVEPEPEEDE